MINKEDIDLLTVRIEIKRAENWSTIGSGVFWIPEDSEYIYIFTAGHVVEEYIESDYEIWVSYFDENSNIKSNIIDKDEIHLHVGYGDHENGITKLCDAAILRSKDITCKRLSYNINLLDDKKRGGGINI